MIETNIQRRRLHLFALLSVILALVLAGCQPIQPMAEESAEAAPIAEAVAEEAPAEEPAAEEAPAEEPAAEEAAAPEMAMPEMPMSEALAAFPQLVIDVSADGIVVPAEVVAGPIVINRTNSAGTMGEDGSPIMANVGRLAEGASLEALLPLLASAQENPGPALELIHFYGGSFMGQPTLADLTPGQYVAVTTSGEPMAAEFTVVEGEAAAVPEPAVTVELNDFSFTMPDEIAAGTQLWEITNAGEQWHELVIVKLNEGVTLEDLFAFFGSAGPEDMPPFEFLGGFGVASPGNRSWIEFDLPAGEYTVLCFLPDLVGDMAPHAMHGMVRTLVVK